MILSKPLAPHVLGGRNLKLSVLYFWMNHIPPRCCQMKILSKIALSSCSTGCTFKLLSLFKHHALECIQSGLLKLKVHKHTLPAASKHLNLSAGILSCNVCTCTWVHVCVCVSGCHCLFGLGKQAGGWVNGQRA